MSDSTLESRLLHYVLAGNIGSAASILCHMEEQGRILGNLPPALLCRVKTVPMLHLLVSHGIRPGAATIHGETALMYFATREHFSRPLVQELLSFKAPMNAQNLETGNTALIIAVCDHNHDMETLLMEAGARLRLRNKLGLSAVDMASIFGNHEFRRNFCHHQ